jgi:hypothetical protein
LIVKKTDAVIKTASQSCAQAAASAASTKEQPKRAEDAKRSAAEKRAPAAAKQQKQKGKRNRIHTAQKIDQRTHDDLMKDMERLKMLLV